MIKEIVNKYERFSDALIVGIRYESLNNSRVVEVVIKCMNSENDYEWETIELTFNDVLLFRFIEEERTSSTVINAALLEEEGGILMFDFFPLILSGSELKQNDQSDFIIKSRNVKCRVL